MVSLCLGKTALYATTGANKIFALTAGRWTYMGDRYSIHCAINDNNDFWAARGVQIPFFRQGVTVSNPAGSSWTHLDGQVSDITSGRRGLLFATNHVHNLFMKSGITDSTPQGSGYSAVRLIIVF